MVEGTEVLVLLQSESVEVGDGSQEGAGGAPRQEESLLLVMEVEGLESFFQVQTGRGQYDHAGDIAVNITSTSSLVRKEKTLTSPYLSFIMLEPSESFQ